MRIMRAPLLLAAAAGLFCGFTATPDYERRVRENTSAAIALATQECWGTVKGQAQVEWYRHLRKIDQAGRADAVVAWTAKSVARCVAGAPGFREHDPSSWRFVDAFVKQRFGIPAHSG
jgi:hypothetical protein